MAARLTGPDGSELIGYTDRWSVARRDWILDCDISAIQIGAQSMLDRLGVPSLEA